MEARNTHFESLNFFLEKCECKKLTLFCGIFSTGLSTGFLRGFFKGKKCTFVVPEDKDQSFLFKKEKLSRFRSSDKAKLP